MKKLGKTPPHGLLVLGMHRSGTSALSRVLGLCGLDLGDRVAGPGLGNETGHWEDNFAVELHERLLASFGAAWDDALALPEGWLQAEPGRQAVTEIRGYLESSRSAHNRWALKDPRLCLFAPAWQAAAKVVSQPLAAVLVLRHPMEVARSLAARDGLPLGRGLLLWLEYSLAAAEAALAAPHALVDYPSLLQDWRTELTRVAALPGFEGLVPTDARAQEIDDFLDLGRRHQAAGDERLPSAVAQAWSVLQRCWTSGQLRAADLAALRQQLAPLRELLHPVLDDWRATRGQLWRRVGRAEATLADEATRLPAVVRDLSRGVEANRAGLIEAISGELRRMQEMVGQAQSSAASREREAQVAADLGPRLSQLSEAIGPRLSQLESALVPMSLQLPAEVRALTEGVEANRAGLIEAISGELRRMQEIASEAKIDAARHEERAEETKRHLDRIREQMEASLEAAKSDLEAAWADGHTLQESILELEQAAARIEAQHTDDLSRLDEARVRGQQLSSELAALRYEVEQLRAVASQFDELRQSRSWRWTRPLRALVRLVTGHFGADDRARLRRALGLKPKGSRAVIHFDGSSEAQSALPVSAHLLPNADEANDIVLAPAQDSLEDVFVWSVIDWHFRFQRPQHLAQALAKKGHRVFYISNNFNDDARPGFHLDALGCDGRLFQVHLNLEGRPPIYFGMPTTEQVEALRASLAELLAWTCTRSSISLVQHPYWSPLLRAVPAARLVYDCMDHHGGFENNAPAVLQAEARLVSDADLVIVTSSWLEQEIAPDARATAMVRNAGEFEFFCHPPSEVFVDPQGRRIIGYYGAIAEWFDVNLIRQVAQAHQDCLVLLVGNDTAGAGTALADLPNVQFIGEVPYSRLPYWLHAFDVCLLPFRVIPLTLATNPVKVYEYLAAGKPVVSVDLPEMVQFDGLVRVAADPSAFVSQVAAALAEPAGSGRDARQAFAASQTWSHRAEALDHALETLVDPKVSVIVLTYNNLAFTDACLFSIEAYSDYKNLEVIVVDNASSDGSREWLRDWVSQSSAAGHTRRLILNDDNLGFSAGNNVGLRAAVGEVLVLLNNDTYATPGWVRGLCNHLRDEPRLGLLGPVTNNIGNEAKIDIGYSDMPQMISAAGRFTRAHPGQRTAMRTAAFFCVAMHREVYQQVGDMDEAFGVGFFEDDDYSRRVEEIGLEIACADDVFIHHHLSASFDALSADRKRELFERNKAIYEAKWGAWAPHIYRSDY